MVHNAQIWERVASELQARGAGDRSWEKCRDRWAYLKRSYRNAKRNNQQSGRERKECPYYEEIDSILGKRPMNVAILNLHMDRDVLLDVDATASSINGSSDPLHLDSSFSDIDGSESVPESFGDDTVQTVETEQPIETEKLDNPGQPKKKKTMAAKTSTRKRRNDLASASTTDLVNKMLQVNEEADERDRKMLCEFKKMELEMEEKRMRWQMDREERQRQEAREREERQRQEAREREERQREKTRERDERARREHLDLLLMLFQRVNDPVKDFHQL
ncbi:DDRGK domain-containing protein 1-like [Anneissia japonica]|uniref:DDRGK domain-containing protein 1-like n=1 Tax=Anneissia japonica TaxID=1529436 RepID=UPI0014257295|nr:DDRGK domain-containing protein 1-like [Anneissia japonica]